MYIKNTLAISIGLVLSTMVSAENSVKDSEDTINFADPTVIYSSFEAAYGTEGATLGFGLASQINEEWGGLAKYEGKKNLNLHRIRAAATNTEIGSGILLDYIWDTDFAGAGADSHSLVVNGLQVLPLGENALFVPMVGVGFTTNDFAENEAAIGMVQAMLVYNFTPEVWANFIPQYTYSFNDLKLKNGDTQSIRRYEFETVVGYRFDNNQNVRLLYKYNEDREHEATLSYTYAF
ncbi:hypothetical protein [Shewanella colwelliana]|uniref:Porin n=1 Tax=Shewanella colwelliana TaxID=23 RepID=A0A1E5IXQ9_SHECO|nr:hypothetical protein [Shewanella colwelliana]MDX1281884.1 hypothetical protein [Shewanella colwelliana]OEG75351.1 hypothetical protein BEL05_09105 [Shewanella colwelliana]